MLRFSGLPPPGVGGGGVGEGILFISGIKMPVYVWLYCTPTVAAVPHFTNSIEINAATHARHTAHCHPALQHVSFLPGHIVIQKNRNARARIFKLLRSPRIDSNDNPTRFLAPINCLKIPALTSPIGNSYLEYKSHHASWQ
jgi:hypothetical protein